MKQEAYGKSYRPRIDVLIATFLGVGYLISMLWSPDPGYCRDETYYFHAGKRYITWITHAIKDIRTRKSGQPIKSFQRKEIKKYWAGFGNNHEHPPFAKILMGASWWIFTQQWRPPPSRRTVPAQASFFQRTWNNWKNAFLDRIKMSDARAFRFPGMLWAALMIFLIYLWGTQAFNRRVGMFAAFAMMLLPRFFFHAQLAAFDVPISALWLLVAYAFWRGMKSHTWGILCGIFFGLALATKHNSWILPGVLGIYWLSQTWNKFRLRIQADGTYNVRFPPMHNAVFSAMLFGPLLMIALWPLLWPTQLFHASGWKETWKHLSFYASFHLQHNHYDAYYWGVLHLKPPFPWHFPVGMTLVTFPLVTVFLTIGGLWFLMRQQRILTHVLWWLVWTIRTPIWGWVVSPLLSLLLSIALLFPTAILGVLWLAIKIIDTLGHALLGTVGQQVHTRLVAWQTNLERAVQRVQHWNPWVEEESKVREYRPRPVGPADKTGLLWLLNAMIPILVIAMPSTPIFGGTKHWMTAWPFLALIAGLGFERICQAIQRSWKIKHNKSTIPTKRFVLLSTAMAVLFLTPALIGTIRSHPHGLAYYNTLIGGPRGSANWGMQRSFWAPSTKQALPWLNKHAVSRKGKHRSVEVDFHDSNASRYYRQNGWLKSRIHEPWRLAARSRPYRPGDYLIFVHQKWLRTQLYHALPLLKARAPSHGVYLDEVPLITVWQRNSSKWPVWW